MSNNLEQLQKNFNVLKDEFIKRCQQAQSNQAMKSPHHQTRLSGQADQSNSQFLRFQSGMLSANLQRKNASSNQNLNTGGSRGAVGPDVQVTGGDHSLLNHNNSRVFSKNLKEQMDMSMLKGIDSDLNVDFDGVRVPILKNISIQLPF
uniref:Uncharacterized protein n=1 Tax=Strombidium rassoulzadegani TaxID=1082188 RepID=A0A7S3CTD2_9SPIT|mmetsp:Transcript_7652/g.12861  ORF Transcript_7652/g.12861 Transcript_7652/m.12861 type:complete len:148 (+) Transcript_7652:65-508(+)